VRRIIGAFAVCGGWICLWVGAIHGVMASGFFASDQAEGRLPSTSVYGASAMSVFWIIVGVAVIAGPAMIVAVFAPDSSRRLNTGAAIAALVGVVLLPDELGRAFGLGFLGCGAFLATGAWLLEEPSPAVAQGAAGGDGAAGPAIASAADRAQSRTARAKAARRPRKGQPTHCPWCSARIPAGSKACPSCHAALVAAGDTDNAPIPGLTVVSADLLAHAAKSPEKQKKGLLGLMRQPDRNLGSPTPEHVEPAVLEPPDARVRAEMARLDREIAARAAQESPPPDR
jgi:hypothetical protein